MSRVDIQSFENFDVSDRNWDKQIAEHLKMMVSEIKELRSLSDNALRVVNGQRSENDSDNQA